MPIVDISPVGSKNYDRPVKVTPVYLLIVEDPTKKVHAYTYYVAIKVDDLGSTVRFVGFETNEKENELVKNYQEIINATDRLIYKEVQLPWQRVIRIQNLIFKTK